MPYHDDYTFAEAARIIGMALSSVYRLARTGRLDRGPTPGTVTRASVEAFLVAPRSRVGRRRLSDYETTKEHDNDGTHNG